MELQEFHGPALVLGSVRGRRSFGMTTDGHLTGLFYSQVWHPGENRASCLHDGGVVVRRPDGGIGVRWSSAREIGAGHGLQGCTCGFYAYYREDPFASSRRISGIVEGYGRVVLGTGGFRCEKARVLALLRPPAAGADTGAGTDVGDVLLASLAPDEVPAVDLVRVRATYPEVVIFDREEDMLAVFPPTADGPEL
ncbi:hypothetical protein [Georgenia yuyongxinii]|uniref:Uncharacterized protein n=1 Tax=Georgenia yuyongxinii TaxID=2589797 RepID=A0A552WLL6_9MICO|nr:hypothetical protein [Georgenia yuyongxinii]TRW43636.1 hypothetical protein FJ693_16895 [Georgenia yuyongxinii]